MIFNSPIRKVSQINDCRSQISDLNVLLLQSKIESLQSEIEYR
jgi:hypothetical protein